MEDKNEVLRSEIISLTFSNSVRGGWLITEAICLKKKKKKKGRGYECMNMLTKALEELQSHFSHHSNWARLSLFFTVFFHNIYISRLAARATSLYQHIMYVYLNVQKDRELCVRVLTSFCWFTASGDNTDIIFSSPSAGPSGELGVDLGVSNFRHVMRFLIGDLSIMVSRLSSWEHLRGAGSYHSALNSMPRVPVFTLTHRLID